MLPQDPDTEMPDRVSQLVAHMLARADAKHLIELFKGQGLIGLAMSRDNIGSLVT
jgi:hypothetical protein